MQGWDTEPDATSDEEAAEAEHAALFDRFVRLGCTQEDAEMLVFAGVDPDVVGDMAPDAVGFVSAAVHHDLPDVNWRLAIAGGDPDRAWEMWAEERGDR